MASNKPPTPQEMALNEAQSLMQLWLKTKTFFGKANTEDPISREEEQAFLESKSEISKYIRTLAPKLPADVQFGGEKIQDLLRQSISIGHLRSLPRADRQTLMSTWHQIFIQISRSAGALQFIAEGYMPPPKQQKGGQGAGGNISDLKKAASNKKGADKSSFFKSKGLWVVLILIAAAVVYFMKRS